LLLLTPCQDSFACAFSSLTDPLPLPEILDLVISQMSTMIWTTTPPNYLGFALLISFSYASGQRIGSSRFF
jgi:hypothetical protein